MYIDFHFVISLLTSFKHLLKVNNSFPKTVITLSDNKVTPVGLYSNRHSDGNQRGEEFFLGPFIQLYLSCVHDDK